MQWLRQTAISIQRMECERRECIMEGKFDKAFSLLKGIKFATNEFRKVSLWLKNKKI